MKTLPDLVARVLETRGSRKGIVGLDESGLGMTTYQKVLKACPNVTFQPALDIWRDIEVIKTTDEELDRLARWGFTGLWLIGGGNDPRRHKELNRYQEILKRRPRPTPSMITQLRATLGERRR